MNNSLFFNDTLQNNLINYNNTSFVTEITIITNLTNLIYIMFFQYKNIILNNHFD